MQITESWIVTVENGIRPAGKQDRCFYCGNLLGELHDLKCVLRIKTIVAKYKYKLDNKFKYEFEVVLIEPDHWNKNDFEFHRNEGTWCADNSLNELENNNIKIPIELREFKFFEDCLCAYFEAEFLREATEEESKRLLTIDY